MPEETLAEEHGRLLRETEELRRNHAALRLNPSDLDGHRVHRVRLQRQIDALRNHIHRIKREGPESSEK